MQTFHDRARFTYQEGAVVGYNRSFGRVIPRSEGEAHGIHYFVSRSFLSPLNPVLAPCAQDLLSRYHAVADATTLHWTARYRKLRLLGAGGQGAVYLSERLGTDRFILPVSLKIFSPEPYRDAEAYEEDMGQVAQVASRVALIQHDNLLDINDFFSQEGVRVMEMEWLDGYDLRRLLTPETLGTDARMRQPRALGIRQPRHSHRRALPNRASSRAWRSKCCGSAWRRWRRCTVKGSSTAISSPRTSC